MHKLEGNINKTYIKNLMTIYIGKIKKIIATFFLKINILLRNLVIVLKIQWLCKFKCVYFKHVDSYCTYICLILVEILCTKHIPINLGGKSPLISLVYNDTLYFQSYFEIFYDKFVEIYGKKTVDSKLNI